MKKLAIVLIPLIAFVLIGCSSGTGYWGSGHVISETRQLSGFDSVFLMTSGDLSIEQGDTESLAIEADDNLLQYLTSDIEGTTLKLSVENLVSLRYVTRIRYHLVVKDLEEVQLFGSGDIDAPELEADHMRITILGSGSMALDGLTAADVNVNLTGSGDLDIHGGTVESQDITLMGSGSYNAEDVESNRADVNVMGSGSARIWVTEQLNATLMGSGDVEYFGDPSVDSNSLGSGDVVHLGNR
jgi:hypothetical protein